MAASSRGLLQSVCIVLGFTTLSYCMWHLTSNALAQNFVPLPIFRGEVKNKSFLILDYTGYIDDAKEDYFIGNCLVTKNHRFVDKAHAVVITTRKLKSKAALPQIRKSWQRWVWLLDESPHHPIDSQPFTLSNFNNVYNWTMTYRRNSDVYIPYGWTKRKDKPEKTIPDLGNREKLVAAVISNCASKYVHNARMDYLKVLNKTVPVALYGRCGKKCPGYTTRVLSVCPELSHYLFYLAFENSNCKEYITEKLFGNGFESGAVPVVLGALKQDYHRITPPNSLINVRDFESPQKLGEYLKYLASNKTAYMQYHMWRKDYTTSNRIQFVTRSIWEPLCQKLNTDDGVQKITPDLKSVWTLSDCDDRVFW